MKEINNTLTQLSEEELENINGGGCTWKKLLLKLLVELSLVLWEAHGVL